tara:strand:- start:275 stop:868 length:594 start_codon:yes stop_codon:yes gene_type:complete
MKLTKKQLKEIVYEELLEEGVLDRLRAKWKGEVAAAGAGPIARVFKGMKALMGGDPTTAAATAKLDPDEKRAVARMKSIMETFYESIIEAHNSFHEDIEKLGVDVEGTRAAELSPILNNAREEIKTRSNDYIDGLDELMRAVGIDPIKVEIEDYYDEEDHEEKTEVDIDGSVTSPTALSHRREGPVVGGGEDSPFEE